MHPQYQHSFENGRHHYSQSGPSGTQVLAVFTLLPLGGMLLALAGLTLAGTVIGMLITTPVSHLQPCYCLCCHRHGLAVTGFLASGAFGLTGLSSLSYVKNCVRRRVTGAEHYSPEQAKDQTKRRMTDMVDYVGQKTKDLGQGIQNKVHEVDRT